LRERDYEAVYAELANARAYNMKLLDGAMVHMHGDLFETTISPREQKIIHISGPG